MECGSYILGCFNWPYTIGAKTFLLNVVLVYLCIGLVLFVPFAKINTLSSIIHMEPSQIPNCPNIDPFHTNSSVLYNVDRFVGIATH